MNISECRYLCINKDKSFEKGKLYWLFPTEVSTLDEKYAYVSNEGQLLTEEYKNSNFVRSTSH
ncbi:MAG TPA: hypothetical protein VK115_10470 [Staphylococcus sp.]|nr:hypothetical protein [Staphylococcus sp.]